MPSLNVHYLPQFVAESDLAGRTVIVIDLLRASSTICHALAAGARCVRPFVEVDQVRRAAQGVDRTATLLGGERGGRRIDGFDLGNSPSEYAPSAVFGQQILFTTTNGAKAIEHARLARRVLIGAAVNRRAVAEAAGQDDEVDILCAGTGGRVTREDVLGAGCLVAALLEQRPWTLNDWAESAHREWLELVTAARALGRTLSEQFARELRETPGGRDLLEIGMDADLTTCAEIDALSVVPAFDPTTGELRLPG